MQFASLSHTAQFFHFSHTRIRSLKHNFPFGTSESPATVHPRDPHYESEFSSVLPLCSNSSIPLR